MHSVRYIHAADLHLDAAFKGLARDAAPHMPDMAARLHSATFTALERLFSLCERERVDFMVIAGDIYNAEDHSLKAQLAMRDGCRRLAEHGIRVFLAHGNHDPLSSRLLTLDWPENVTIFGDQPESHVVMRDDEPIAVVHGISHATEKEGRNLARGFQRLASSEELKNCFQLGVLHCTLENGDSKAEKYAPCSEDDLAETGLDAWALGHIHDKRVVRKADPFILYPGNIQGLHINETGARGCTLVSVSSARKGFAFDTHFHPLAPVQWAKVEPRTADCKTLGELEAAMGEALDFAARQTGPECGTLIARITLSGRTALNEELRLPGAAADLAEKLGDRAVGRPAVLLKDIVLETRPLADMENMLKRDDLLGEVLRLAGDISQSPDKMKALALEALDPIHKHARLRKAITMPDEAEMTSLLNDARQICIDIMEAE